MPESPRGPASELIKRLLSKAFVAMPIGDR
jgi:hypothetical protein